MMESFNTCCPWREPESAEFHREIWSPVGAYTPTQQHERAGQKNKQCTHRFRFKHPAKYCTLEWAAYLTPSFFTVTPSQLLFPALLVVTVTPPCPTLPVYFDMLISSTCASRHTVCSLLHLSLSVNSQQESVPRLAFLPGNQTASCE